MERLKQSQLQKEKEERDSNAADDSEQPSPLHPEASSEHKDQGDNHKEVIQSSSSSSPVPFTSDSDRDPVATSKVNDPPHASNLNNQKSQKFSLPSLIFFEDKRKGKEKDKEKDKESKERDKDRDKERERDGIDRTEAEERNEPIFSPKPNLKSLTGNILKIPKRLSSSTPPLSESKPLSSVTLLDGTTNEEQHSSIT